MRLGLSKKLFFGSLFSGIFWSSIAKAVCPVCVVAVGGGLGLSRWLGVDDVISSLWMGAILVALILWTVDFIKKRNWRFAYDWQIVSAAYYALTLAPLYYAGILGHPDNKIFGIDRIIFGIGAGTAFFLLGNWLNIYLKKKNSGRVLFYYQKVVFPLSALLLASILFYSLILLKWI